MKISDIKAYPLWVGQRNLCLVKVETDEGVYGWGESGLSSRELAVIGAIKHFREFLIGRDPAQIGAIGQELYRGQYFEGGRVLTAAASAIDLALWDIAGKTLGVPVYQLLGGRQRNKIPCFATSIQPFSEQLIDEVRGLVKDGFGVIRTAAGNLGSNASPTELDVPTASANAAAVLTELRAEIGQDVVLGIDIHHRMTVAQTASFVHRMPVGTLDFLEEPIRQQTPGAYRALRRMVDVPFAIGEECASKWDFRAFIEGDLTNYARIDVCNVGGLTEAMKIAAMAETHYIDVMPHDPLGPICTSATIHMCAAIPNLAWCEIPPYGTGSAAEKAQYFDGIPTVTDCHYELCNAPGLGVEVNEEAVRAQSFKFWEAPRMVKPDGSFTNW